MSEQPRKKHFIVYRDLDTKKIIRYSFVNTIENESVLVEKIKTYNSDVTRNHTAELVYDRDLYSALEIAEKNQKIKESEIRNIEDRIEGLSNDFYALREALK